MVTHQELSIYGKTGAEKRWGKLSTKDRFWKFVQKGGASECWPWTGTGTRYGLFRFEGRLILAHRIAYILSKGEIPDGLCVCHSCDNGFCCNPDHLWIGTHKQNMMDMAQKGRAKPPDNRGRVHIHKYSNEFVRGLREEFQRYKVTAKQLAIRHGMTFQTVRALLYSGKHYV